MELKKKQENEEQAVPASTPSAPAPAEPAAEEPAPQPEPVADWEGAPTLESLATGIARISAEIRQQKMAFQDSEVALVARIADVDDDRRQAATRLQRTLQAQREELDTRFKRQAALFAWLVLIFVLLVGGALGLAYLQFKGMRDSLASEVSGLRTALASIEIPEPSTADPRAREKLGALTKAVDEISESLARIGSTDPEPPRAESPAPPQPAAPQPTAESPKTAAPKPAAVSAPETKEPAASDSKAKPDDPKARSDEADLGRDSQPKPDEGSAVEVKKPAPETGAAAPVPGRLPPGQLAETPPAPASKEQAEAPAKAESFKVGDRRFTIQLMGFFSLESLGKFAKEHSLPAEIYYQTTTYQGRPWYVLIHSIHSSQSDAETTVAALPKDLGKLDIWVRQLDPEKEINRFVTPAN